MFAKTYTSFSAYVKGTGYEQLNGMTVGKNLDPFLVGPPATVVVGVARIDGLERSLDGFKLSPASPLRDAGLDLFVFGVDPGPRDFYGNGLRGDGRTDIGAHEYV